MTENKKFSLHNSFITFSKHAKYQFQVFNNDELVFGERKRKNEPEELDKKFTLMINIRHRFTLLIKFIIFIIKYLY